MPRAIRMVQIAVEVGGVRFASGRAGAEWEFVVVEWWGVEGVESFAFTLIFAYQLHASAFRKGAS